jgi:hypothetical protein
MIHSLISLTYLASVEYRTVVTEMRSFESIRTTNNTPRTSQMAGIVPEDL